MFKIFFNFFLFLISFSLMLSMKDDEIISQRKVILFDDDWEFQMNGDKEWQKIYLPHDFSISQKFDEKYEAESGFLPGGTALYRKKFKLPPMDYETSAIIYFYGVYNEAYVSINGVALGENHYGYNSFSFDLSKNLIIDGETENLLEVKVVHNVPSSRWYSGSGIYRSVELILTRQIHVAVDGLKITTPDIESGKGTVKVDAEIINEAKNPSKIKLNVVIKDKEGKSVSEGSSEEVEIQNGNMKIVSAELSVEKPSLWSDIEPNLYTVELELLADGEKVDEYTDKFGFRYYSFDKDKGFILNGKPTKLNGVSIHHDYGALGSIDIYDAGLKRFKQLKEMGINSIRTTHNPAHKTWIKLCDELGLLAIEEMFDCWNHSKGGNTDFAKFFNTGIDKSNLIIGGKQGMTWAEYVIKSTIKRDRNSPSIILWSTGNEINNFDSTSPTIAKNLVLWGKEIDETRPFTIGENKVYRDYAGDRFKSCEEIRKSGGIIGFNYATHTQLKEGTGKFGPIYLSESASALNSRGVYSLLDNGGLTKKNDGKYHLTSYDTSYPSWANTAHYFLWTTLANDYVAGQFVWTGFDYIGEPTPWLGSSAGSQTGKGPIPNSAYFGIIDSAGFPKDSYYLYRSQLRKDSTTVHLLTAWDKNNIFFSDDSKKKTPVHVYTNAPKLEIYRNDNENEPICTLTRTVVKTNVGHEYYTFKGESNNKICEAISPSNDDLGTDLFGRFNIEFLEGSQLFTKAYDEDNKLIEQEKIIGNQKIAAPNKEKLDLDIKVDKEEIDSDGKNLAYVEVSIVDDKGILDTKANNLISFSLEGKGKILGVDNGDQATVDKYQQESVKKGDDFAVINAYAGKALVIIASNREEGDIELTISSEGFEEKVVNLLSVMWNTK